MFIDSHCHLNLLVQEDKDLAEIIQQAQENKVEHILSISIDIQRCHEVISIAEKYSHITASVGVHPNVDKTENCTVNEIIKLASHNKVIAIGETGLDYFRVKGDLEWQRDRFRRHIEAAKQLKKPLIVHTRGASEDTMNILEEEDAYQVGGIIHCFTENWSIAKRALDIGFYISLSGIITFTNSLELQKVVKKLPIDKILIETDAPYLAPVPHRGEINKPAFVKYIAQSLATLRGESIENIAITTTNNFKRLFPII